MTTINSAEIYTYQKIEMKLSHETDTHFFYQNKNEKTHQKPPFKIAFNKNTEDLKSKSLIYLESKYNYDTNYFEYTFDCVMSNLEEEESVSIYFSTVQHLLDARFYPKDELKEFQLEQVIELAKYADINQFNEICSLEIDNQKLHDAIAIRYLMFFDQVDLEIEDFCEMFEIDNRIYRFIQELNINNTICNSSKIIATVLSRLDTPPTYHCLSLFQEHFHDDCASSYFIIDKAFSNIDFFNSINGHENEIDKDSFIKGYNKHFMFAVDAAMSLIENNNGSHSTLLLICDAMDSIHRSGLDKEWVEKLFNFSNNQSGTFIAAWGDVWSIEYFVDFRKGNLFDYWISHKKECWLYNDCTDNIRYFVDNFKTYLVNSSFNFDALYESIPFDLKYENGEELSREEIFDMKEIQISNHDLLTNILKLKENHQNNKISKKDF